MVQKIIDKHSQATDEQSSMDNTENQHIGNEKIDTEREMDILNLPPRKEIHGGKKSKIHLTLSKPILRLTVVLLIMIAIVAMIYFLENDQLQLITVFYKG